MRHAEGCKGGRVRTNYRRGLPARRYCSSCGRRQNPDLPVSLQAVQTGRYDASRPNSSAEPRSLISRALERLRLS